MKERIALIDNSHPLSIRRQAQILSVNRSQLNDRPAGEKEQNLMLMETMDKIFLSDPTLGVLGMQDELAEKGMIYNVKRIRRLLRKMAIEPIYPKRNLSRLGKAKYIHPYLLRHLEITRPNQPGRRAVWALDISYIPRKHGFMYHYGFIQPLYCWMATIQQLGKRNAD